MYPVDLLPSPFHLFESVLSVLKSVQLSRKAAPGPQPTLADFDVNIQTNTGFLPERPLPRLPEAYSSWEDALTRAPEALVLGENIMEEDTQIRADGELWRSQVRGVSKIDIEQ